MRTIVWDVDDVLNGLMHAWFTRAWMKEHPECRIEYSGLTENPPHSILGVAPEQYLASIDAFRETESGMHLAPNAAVLDDAEENLSQATELGLRTVTWPQPGNRSTQDTTNALLELTREARGGD
jgi:hypothetical protein